MINRDFKLLLSGQLVSQVGDKFQMIALSFWVLENTGSPAKMGSVMAAFLIPSLILGFVSGAVIDRYSRKVIIVGTDIFRGIIITGFAVLLSADLLSFPLILLMQVLLSVNAAFFDPAIPSVIPMIVSKEDLGRANSGHQFVNGFSMVAGAFLGGVFVGWAGYFWAFALNAASFFLSAACESFIQVPVPPGRPADSKKTRLTDDMKKGYQYIFSRQALVILLFMVGLIHFFVGAIEIILPVLADTISSSGAGLLGYLHAALGLGTIVSAGVLSTLNIKGREKEQLFISVFFMGCLYLAGAYFPGAAGWYLVMIFLFGSAMISAGISFRTLLQKNTDNEFAGRVFGVANSIGNGSIPAAMMIFGVLLERFDYQDLFLISGLVLSGLSMASMKLYKERENEETDSENRADPNRDEDRKEPAQGVERPGRIS